MAIVIIVIMANSDCCENVGGSENSLQERSGHLDEEEGEEKTGKAVRNYEGKRENGSLRNERSLQWNEQRESGRDRGKGPSVFLQENYLVTPKLSCSLSLVIH